MFFTALNQVNNQLDFLSKGSVTAYMPEQQLSIHELREQWTYAWGRKPHLRIGRVMLEKSLAFKRQGTLTPEQQERLTQLVRHYKRNPKCFYQRTGGLKPGNRLERIYNGKKYSILVKSQGFEYQGQIYNSLSQIAGEITGTRWNGWVFFGLKK